MDAETTVRLGIAGVSVEFELSRDGEDSWRVSQGGLVLGLVYKLTGGRWKARPQGKPASAVEHESRAKAIVALFEAS